MYHGRKKCNAIEIISIRIDGELQCLKSSKDSLSIDD